MEGDKSSKSSGKLLCQKILNDSKDDKGLNKCRDKSYQWIRTLNILRCPLHILINTFYAISMRFSITFSWDFRS